MTPPTNPPVASSTNKLSDDGVFYPVKPGILMKNDDSKTVVNADPPPLSLPKQHSKIAHSKEAHPKPEVADSGVAAESGNGHPYTIKSGQTLCSIASEIYGNSRFWVAIQRENKGLDANHLKVGSKIMLPDISPLKPGPITTVSDEEPMMAAATSSEKSDHTYVVKSGDSLYGICKHLFGTGARRNRFMR